MAREVVIRCDTCGKLLPVGEPYRIVSITVEPKQVEAVESLSTGLPRPASGEVCSDGCAVKLFRKAIGAPEPVVNGR